MSSLRGDIDQTLRRNSATADVKESAALMENRLATLSVCLAFAAVFAVSCRDRAASRSVPPGQSVRRIATPRACLDTAGEEQALACAPRTVRRTNDTLSIRLADGHVLTFVNTPPGEFEHGVMFRGTIASVPLYIISSFGGERPPDYSMIDGRSGATPGFEELPLFSPDSTRFAVNSPSWMDCDLGNGGSLAIWRLTDGLPTPEWHVESWDCGPGAGWAADGLRWRSPDTLSFTRNEIADRGRVRGAKQIQLLVRSDSNWQIVPPPSKQK